MNQNQGYSMKFGLIGNRYVGKTSLIKRFRDGDNYNPNDTKLTIAIDVHRKIIELQNHQCELLIYDTIGLEQYQSLTSSHFKQIACGIFVYDLTNYESFNLLQKYLETFEDNAPKYAVKVLVANKCDLVENYQQQLQAGKQFAIKNQMHFIQTSAQNGINVEKLFFESATLVLDLVLEKKIDLTNRLSGVKLTTQSQIKPQTKSVIKVQDVAIQKNNGCC